MVVGNGPPVYEITVVIDIERGENLKFGSNFQVLISEHCYGL